MVLLLEGGGAPPAQSGHLAWRLLPEGTASTRERRHDAKRPCARRTCPTVAEPHLSEGVVFGRKKKQANISNEAASNVAAQIMGRLLVDYPQGHVITADAVAQVTDLRVLEFANEALKAGKSPAEIAAFRSLSAA